MPSLIDTPKYPSGNFDSQRDFVQKPLPSAADKEIGRQPGINPAIHLLRWLELISLELDYKEFRKRESIDSWYYVKDAEAQGPVTFTEILARLRNGDSPLAVIHESKAHNTDPRWSSLAYNPVWNRPLVAIPWTIGFWLVVACAGYVALQLLLPDSIRHIVGIAYWFAALAYVVNHNKERWFGKYIKKPAPIVD